MTTTDNETDTTPAEIHDLGDRRPALLQTYVRRIEVIEAEMDMHKEDRRTVYKEATEAGLDSKILRQIIRDRKKAPDILAGEIATLEDYRRELGLLFDTPLGEAALASAAQ